MIDQIFVEKNIQNHERVQNILKFFNKNDPILIDSVENYFGKTKKPYLQKRTNLNIFVGTKKGQLVKPAPDAYGLSGEPHFYFIHAYNCIYECTYCYLQGYFDSPDLVFFINHEDIQKEILEVANQHTKAWFHAGEFSDSLALSHVTKEWDGYFKLFKNLPQHKLELRTKSNNIKNLLKLESLPNVFISYTLSPTQASKNFDLKTPSLKLRLEAMQQLAEAGHPLGIHLDPMIYTSDFQEQYLDLVNQLFSHVQAKHIHYVSLGTIRFTKDVYRATQQNYPTSTMFHQKFSPSFDQKLRYPKPLRYWMMGFVQDLLIKHDLEKDKIYWCME
jgi:spore photoproduct lyase